MSDENRKSTLQEIKEAVRFRNQLADAQIQPNFTKSPEQLAAEQASDRADSQLGKTQPDSTKGNFQYVKDVLKGDTSGIVCLTQKEIENGQQEVCKFMIELFRQNIENEN